MTLHSQTVVFLLWMGCTTCKASAGAACEDPPLVDFGEIVSGHKSGYKESDSVQYACNLGYTLSGSEWVMCHEKIWVPGPPECLAPCTITKQQLEAQNLLLSNGQRRTFLIQSGQWQKFMCMTGFKLTASPIKQCSDGHIELPSCITEIICDLPEILHGYVHSPKESYKESEQLQFACDEGYRYGERADAQCTASGWNPTPYCTEMPCGSIPKVANTQIEGRNKDIYEPGETVRYQCDAGFLIVGPPEIICREGNWTAPPFCEEMPCGSIPKVANTQIEGRNKDIYEPGETVRYQCDAGFLIVGPPEIICREGNWTAPPFCEEMPCGSIPKVANTQIEGRNKDIYEPGETVRYQCDAGFLIVGPPEIICREGNWTAPPFCEEMPCGSIPKVANTQIEGRNKDIYEPGETVRYQCDAGFLIVGPPEIICREGNWTAPPFCEDVSCGAAPEIPNAYITSTPPERYLPGARVQYECENNFQMMGGNYVSCRNGEWSQAPTCREIVCSPPRIPNGNFRPQEDNYIVGDVITIECDPGYHFKTLTGKTTSECTKNGWVPDPGCVQKPCDYPAIENGKLSGTLEYYKNYYFPMRPGQHADYHCNTGYSTPTGQYWVRIACSERGWSPAPKCLSKKPPEDKA
ncbi:complement factor H-like [Opisthocomus hoazin]|uniref:complement factor H-like n=1 Tax=Opisthocomus hoazin TaxID=30419 RepID=UPI003F52D2EF